MSEEEGKLIEPGADIEEISTPEEKLTLAQRIEKLSLIKKPAPYRTEVNQEFCMFCGSPRLDPDPTGVTCNKPQCLAELGKEYLKVIEELEAVKKAVEKKERKTDQ